MKRKRKEEEDDEEETRIKMADPSSNQETMLTNLHLS